MFRMSLKAVETIMNSNDSLLLRCHGYCHGHWYGPSFHVPYRQCHVNVTMFIVVIVIVVIVIVIFVVIVVTVCCHHYHCCCRHCRYCQYNIAPVLVVTAIDDILNYCPLCGHCTKSKYSKVYLT